MLEAHSLLWHYLWLAPHLLQVVLAFMLWRRGMHKLYPVFLAYILFEAAEEFLLYGMDVLPWVSGATFWFTFSVGLAIEGMLRFALIGELFLGMLRPWKAVADFGNRLITIAGVVLVLLATLAAAYAPIDDPASSIISRAHILQQTLYIIQAGLILFLFLFTAHFRLSWNNRSFGIALGLGIVACEHLGTWALTTSGALLTQRHLLDFLNMATYHVCVLIWFYYLLAPARNAKTSTVTLPEHDLDIWNRELERLLQS